MFCRKTQKKKPQAKESVGEIFPMDSRINAYGFIFMKNRWLEALGWTKGMALKIERNPDGSITVRKA